VDGGKGEKCREGIWLESKVMNDEVMNVTKMYNRNATYLPY
jgi:hypothetical protein